MTRRSGVNGVQLHCIKEAAEPLLYFVMQADIIISQAMPHLFALFPADMPTDIAHGWQHEL